MMTNINMHRYENIISDSTCVSRKKKNVVKDAPNVAPKRRNNIEVIRTNTFLFFTSFSLLSGLVLRLFLWPFLILFCIFLFQTHILLDNQVASLLSS